MKITRVEFCAKLPATVSKKGKYYLASCPILDVHSQGNTDKEAKKNLIEALSLFFISSFERGTLDEVLKECGFTPAYTVDEPQEESPDIVEVPIPFNVNVN